MPNSSNLTDVNSTRDLLFLLTIRTKFEKNPILTGIFLREFVQLCCISLEFTFR